jgi:hypothetical protein
MIAEAGPPGKTWDNTGAWLVYLPEAARGQRFPDLHAIEGQKSGQKRGINPISLVNKGDEGYRS